MTRGRGTLGSVASRLVRPIALVLAGVMLLLLAESDVVAADGAMYRGVADDSGSVAATPRLQASARKGNARAQTMLGFAYATGRGVPQNYVVAVMWYRRAAMRGNATAQYLLGLMYDKGQGVPPDKIVAHKWLILAVAGASNREREYYVRIRDAVASTMTAGQIAEAQALAYQWTVTHER